MSPMGTPIMGRMGKLPWHCIHTGQGNYIAIGMEIWSVHRFPRYSFSPMGTPIGGEWANDHDVAQLQQTHKCLLSKKSVQRFQRYFTHEEVHEDEWAADSELQFSAIGKWHCTTQDQDNSVELRRRKFFQSVPRWSVCPSRGYVHRRWMNILCNLDNEYEHVKFCLRLCLGTSYTCTWKYTDWLRSSYIHIAWFQTGAAGFCLKRYCLLPAIYLCRFVSVH